MTPFYPWHVRRRRTWPCWACVIGFLLLYAVGLAVLALGLLLKLHREGGL